MCVFWSFSFAVVMRITTVRSMCVHVCGRKLGSLLFYCFHREPPGRSTDYSPKQRGWMFRRVYSCIGVCVYCTHVCERSYFLSTYSSRIIGVAWRVPEPWWEGGPWLWSCSPIAVAGLWGAYCVCACLQALSVCIELGETETERAGNQS